MFLISHSTFRGFLLGGGGLGVKMMHINKFSGKFLIVDEKSEISNLVDLYIRSCIEHPWLFIPVFPSICWGEREKGEKKLLIQVLTFLFSCTCLNGCCVNKCPMAREHSMGSLLPIVTKEKLGVRVRCFPILLSFFKYVLHFIFVPYCNLLLIKVIKK